MSIFEAATIEEAIAQGLKALGLERDQVTIEIVEEGKKGFFGMGKKNFRISMEPVVSEEAKPSPVVEKPVTQEVIKAPVVEESIKPAPQIKKATTSEGLSDEEALTQLAIYLTDISKALDAPALVKMTREDHLFVFQLETEKQGILIGKHGKVLNALQYLAQVFIHRLAQNKISVVINVGNYREKRQAILQRLAERTAEKVDRTGRPIFLEPMPAFERKQIHAALSKKDYVKTHSEGEEPYRYLVVEPAKKYY
ncbi:RNA-binding cell elongation regulator Jag/EloR [Enterococcus eurekensis]|uniref:RNA-binding protein KhpB n=2 Tax=Enterococcus TaxID=1350 RepID=A0ABV9M4D3_9ENTE|nr:protein jag [Candidatus Enterococcus avicola]